MLINITLRLYELEETSSLNLPFTIILSIWRFIDISCKLYIGLINIFPQLQGWVLCFCSVDRMFFVLQPHNFNFKNKLIFKIILSVITVFV